HKMVHPLNHPAHAWVILMFHHLMKSAQPKGLNRSLLRFGTTNRALHPGYSQLAHNLLRSRDMAPGPPGLRSCISYHLPALSSSKRIPAPKGSAPSRARENAPRKCVSALTYFLASRPPALPYP